MNNVAKKLALSLLLSIPCLQATNTTGQSFYFGHQQRGTLVEILGWNHQIHIPENDELDFVFKAQTEGGTSFSNSKLAPYFTSNGTATMVFGPHNSTTNPTVDVYSVNFLLSQTFQSSVVFNPKITTWVTDFAAYVDLGNWVQGLHLRGHLPLQYLKHELALTETVSAAGSTQLTSGFIDNAAVNVPYTTVVGAFVGDKVAGDVLQIWNYGTINGAQHSTKVSDIELMLGYNFINNDRGRFDLEFGGLFGCGGKSKAQYVFEPTFGNLGRMGVVGMIDGQALLWSNEDDSKQLAAYLNGKVGYVFSNTQKRSYDLTNFGNWSRYLIVKKFSSVGTTGTTVYAGVDNMINVGTLGAKIGDYVTFDVEFMFDLQYNNFNFNLGYECAGHSKEKHKSFVDAIAANTYVVHVPIATETDLIDVAVGTADATTAQGCQNTTGYGINGNIASLATLTELTTANATTVAIANSWLDTSSVLAPTAVSQAVVGAINYTWKDNDYLPSLGLYGKAEFDGHNHNTADIWTVGVQGNVSF